MAWSKNRGKGLPPPRRGLGGTNTILGLETILNVGHSGKHRTSASLWDTDFDRLEILQLCAKKRSGRKLAFISVFLKFL